MDTEKDIDTEKNSEEKKEKISKNKRTLKRVFCIVVAIIVVLMAASFGMSLYLERGSEESTQNASFNFAPANYDENIYEDPEYMKLVERGLISYTDYSTNLTLGISYEEAIDHGKDVQFMVDYIYAIIAGDADAYNDFFSDAYYKKNDPKEKFTMQKLYEVNIAKASETKETDSSGNSYSKYEYVVKYKILDNNGTFRDDFNTGTKEQHILFTNKGGEFLIDSISTPKIK